MNATNMKQIQGFPNYYISEDGKVYSKNLKRFLKKRYKRDGYVCYALYRGETPKKQYNKLAHRLVAEAFLANPEDKEYINHKDGVKDNNHVGNLEWVTSSENQIHAINTGLKDNSVIYGEKHGNNKLKKNEVEELYINHLMGKTRDDFVAKSLGKIYGVDGRVILSIYRKESWKWLTDELDKKYNKEKI